jgi:hypothetical protein
VSLVETARVRLEVGDAEKLLDLYGMRGGDRLDLLALATEAAEGSQADALAWITSHSFRKTTATILDEPDRVPGRSRTSSVTPGRR